ncbi:MAG: aldo/keto reductase [Bryobacteraceae bacterium]|nr:aldo/keto reductase [Bryobacteraceae bacterium]MDW8378483.1 aldo/keto reductase [Bryobacterales bacterium]
MQRRTFLTLPASALALDKKALAQTPMPMARLGKSGLHVSRFTLGGYHMRVRGEQEAIRIIHRALELGVNFFDSAAKYHDGGSDEAYGKALESSSLRQKAILMSKAQLRDRDGAMKQLEMTLRRMRTDYLDLWQCHEVGRHEEVDQILGPKGALEAFVLAKKQGKVRHIGFTGHHDPGVHQRLLDAFDGWETVQHPVNLIDPHYLSFIGSVMPNIKKKGLGLIGMKSNAIGGITGHRIASIEECLRFALSQPVDTLVSGVESVEQLEQNVAVVKTFRRMTPQEMTSLLERTKQGPVGVKVERYKKSETQAVHLLQHEDGEAPSLAWGELEA